MPGWQGSDRHDTLPPNWPTIRARILRRDNNRCAHIREDTQRRCGLPAHEVDHIRSYKQGGTDDDSNLQTLCRWHHGRKTGREGGTASGKARAARKAASAPLHPGLIPAPPPTEELPPF